MAWIDKLNSKERKHLRDMGIRTLREVKNNVAYQSLMMFPCWDCVSMGRKLGIPVKLTAFDERCRAKHCSEERQKRGEAPLPPPILDEEGVCRCPVCVSHKEAGLALIKNKEKENGEG